MGDRYSKPKICKWCRDVKNSCLCKSRRDTVQEVYYFPCSFGTQPEIYKGQVLGLSESAIELKAHTPHNKAAISNVSSRKPHAVPLPCHPMHCEHAPFRANAHSLDGNSLNGLFPTADDTKIPLPPKLNAAYANAVHAHLVKPVSIMALPIPICPVKPHFPLKHNNKPDMSAKIHEKKGNITSPEPIVAVVEETANNFSNADSKNEIFRTIHPRNQNPAQIERPKEKDDPYKPCTNPTRHMFLQQRGGDLNPVDRVVRSNLCRSRSNSPAVLEDRNYAYNINFKDGKLEKNAPVWKGNHQRNRTNWANTSDNNRWRRSYSRWSTPSSLSSTALQTRCSYCNEFDCTDWLHRDTYT